MCEDTDNSPLGKSSACGPPMPAPLLTDPAPLPQGPHPRCFSVESVGPGPSTVSAHSCTVAAKKENKFMLLIYISPEIMNSCRDANCAGVENHPAPCMKADVSEWPRRAQAPLAALSLEVEGMSLGDHMAAQCPPTKRHLVGEGFIKIMRVMIYYFSYRF